jgi:hypothetical protein
VSRRVRALEEDVARLQAALMLVGSAAGQEIPDELIRMAGLPPVDLARRVRAALADGAAWLRATVKRFRRVSRPRWPRSGSRREILRVLQEHAVELDALQYTMKAACDAAGVGQAVPDRWRRPHLSVVRGGSGGAS